MNELTDIQTSMANASTLMGEAAKAIREKDATIERQRDLIRELVEAVRDANFILIDDYKALYDSHALMNGSIPDVTVHKELFALQKRIEQNRAIVARARTELGE